MSLYSTSSNSKFARIFEEIVAADSLKQKVKELEDSISTLRVEKSSLEEAYKAAVRAKDEELE